MSRSIRGGSLVALLLVAVVAACTSSSSGSNEPGATSSGGTETGTITGQGTVGHTGGQVATSDGVLTVTVPEGALPADTQITITEMQSPAPGTIGKTYDIGPSGTQFAAPVTLTFKYGGFDLLGNDPTSLEVATIVSGEWVGLAGNAVDTVAQVATGQTTHLSPYGVHAKNHGGGNDSGPSSDAATSDGGGGDSSVQQDSGVDAAAGCTPVAQQVGSCANHPQICPVGKVFSNCVNLVPQGYTASCCLPST